MGKIQWVPAHPHLPLISHHIQRKNLPFMSIVCQERHAPCKWNLGFNITWFHHLQHNDWAMIRWVCGVTSHKSQVSSQDLVERMQLDDLAKVLCSHWLKWHDHIECSDGWLKKIQKLNPTGGCHSQTTPSAPSHPLRHPRTGVGPTYLWLLAD